MLRFLRLFLALFLSQLLILIIAVFFLGSMIAGSGPAGVVESGSLLRVPLMGEIIEYPTLPPVPFLRRTPLSQSAILEALEAAAGDDRIEAVVLDLDDPIIGWGKAAELHQAILRFRESRKPVLAVAPVLDELGLFLVSACDSVYMPATGRLYLNGIALGPMYFKGTLEKLDIRPNVSRIGAYKDAAEAETRREMSAESREQYEWLLDDIWGEFLETITARRNLGRADLEEALSRGILQPQDAVELGLVDRVLYREELLQRYVEDPSDNRWVEAADYSQEARERRRKGRLRIAVVHTRGLILRGGNDYSPGVGPILGASSVVRDLETVAADDAVAAVVLRIDSPGGEIVASDMISNAVERLRRRKPVVVSMVDVAASGGYMMSFRANRILALPTTITGSIGSITSKWNIRGFYHKLGMSRDFVTRGSYPFLFSDYHNWSAAEESLITRQQWADYQRWIDDIAANRHLVPEMVDDLGRGRVWTGQQALEHGLIDELGGQEQAIQIARELTGLPTGISMGIVHYPEAKSFFDLLLQESDALWAGVVERWARSPRLPRGASWGVLELGFLP